MTVQTPRFSSSHLERLLLVLLLLLPPLFVWFWAYEAYMFPKRIVIAFLASALAGTMAWRAASDEPLRIELHPVNGLFALWWLWNAISMAWADSPTLALERTVWLGILFAVLVLAQNHWIGRRGALVRAGGWLVVAATLIALWALWMDFWALLSPRTVPVLARLGDWRDRVSAAGLGNTGHIADFLTLAMAPAVVLYLHARRRWTVVACFAALLLFAAALIVCWSVHSNASLILVFLLGLPILIRIHPWRWWRRKARRVFMLLLAWAAVSLFFMLPHPANPHPGGIFREAFASPRWEAGWSTRVVIWKTTVQMIRENPILGVGAGNFTFAYPSVNAESVRSDPALALYANRWTNAAHNEILQAWGETGFPGLFLLAATALVALAMMLPRIRKETRANRLILWCATLGLGAWILQAQMNFPLQMPVGALWFVLLLSVGPALAPRHPGRPPAILFPVQFGQGIIRVFVYMKNMRRPSRLAIEFRFGASGRRVVALVAVGIVLAVAVLGVRGLLSGVEYRKGREATFPYLRPPHCFSSEMAVEALEKAGPHYRAALRYWPWMTDARHWLSDLLIRAGAIEEGLYENEKVRRRLNAIEILFRDAWGHLALGEIEQAREAFAEIQRRSIERDTTPKDGIPDNLPINTDSYWSVVYFQLLQALR